ncbi:hypothetical protein ACI6PS_03580 [Flavobacterium sp. PLA-1-15]|uniref:hypothetical protein n=1 Tax=Flavobacterium sp. PLA-1-15 TaxID=3380533 RepID=UPI003B798F10
MPKVIITVEVEVSSPSDKQNLEATIKKLSALPFDDRQRLSEIIGSQKALNALASKWTMLKLMFK